MADDVDETMEESSKRSGRRRNLIIGGILLGVMLAEGAIVVVLVKHFGPEPASAEAGQGMGGLNPTEGEKAADEVEVEVARFRAQNEQARQLVVYDLSVYVTVAKGDEEKCKERIEKRHMRIQDALTSVVGSADAQVLMETDRATLRQRFQQELNQILGGEQMIRKVLIPSFVKYREG